MRAEIREKLIERMEEAVRWAGSPDFETGMEVAYRFFDVMRDGVARMKTKDDVRKFFDDLPDPSPLEEALILASAKFAPQMISSAVKKFAAMIAADTPRLPRGRPKTDFQEKARIVAYVGKLHIQGCSLELSKTRAAKRFGVSESTVQRIWDDRASIGEPDFHSAMTWLLSGDE
jgi:hypothetical protein